MIVARIFRRNKKDHHHHQRHGQHQFEFHIFHRSANRDSPVRKNGHLYRSGQTGLQQGQKSLDAVHHLNDVRARLPLDIDDHRGGHIHPRGLLHVLHVVHHVRHIRELHGRAVVVGDHHIGEFLAGQQLIVGINLVILVRPVKISQRGIQAGGLQCRPHVFQVDSVRRKSSGIHLHAHGGLLSAADAHQSHARQLGNLLSQARVRQVFHLRQGNRLGR